MYRQIALSKKSKDYHRVVWREFLADAVKTYRMTRVTFGVGCSSHLAIRSLQEAIVNSPNPQTSAAILKDIYVDDLISGAKNEEEAWQLIQDIIETLAKSCFPLRKIASSCRAIVNRLPESFRENATAFEFNDSDEHVIKTLGVHWSVKSDTLGFTVPHLDKEPCSAKDKKKLTRQANAQRKTAALEAKRQLPSTAHKITKLGSSGKRGSNDSERIPNEGTDPQINRNEGNDPRGPILDVCTRVLEPEDVFCEPQSSETAETRRIFPPLTKRGPFGHCKDI
jgi:hypothetical protein